MSLPRYPRWWEATLILLAYCVPAALGHGVALAMIASIASGVCVGVWRTFHAVNVLILMSAHEQRADAELDYHLGQVNGEYRR